SPLRRNANMGKDGNKPVGSRPAKPPRRLAIPLRLAIGALERNIRKLERTGATPLLIATRKKRLAKMRKELASLEGPRLSLTLPRSFRVSEQNETGRVSLVLRG